MSGGLEAFDNDPERIKREQIQGVADKITKIFDLVEKLTDEDMKYLHETANAIEKQASTIRATQGILVDFDMGEARIKSGKQAVARIKGLVSIRNALKETPKISGELLQKQIQKRILEQSILGG